jgi:D-alanyl-D-alanine dipeptidase
MKIRRHRRHRKHRPALRGRALIARLGAAGARHQTAVRVAATSLGSLSAGSSGSESDTTVDQSRDGQILERRSAFDRVAPRSRTIAPRFWTTASRVRTLASRFYEIDRSFRKWCTLVG